MNPIVHASPVWFASSAALHASSTCHRREVSFHTAWNGPMVPPTPNSSFAGARGNADRFVRNAMAAPSFAPWDLSPVAS